MNPQQLEQLLTPVQQFLGAATPDVWIEHARSQLPLLLIDHANCELTAAQTAMFLLRRYALDQDSGDALLAWAKPYEEFVYRADRDVAAFVACENSKSEIGQMLNSKNDDARLTPLVAKMLRLIREEFHHFDQVIELMAKLQLPYQSLGAGRYAKGLMRHVRTHEPATLVDKLIVGAFIEARSCERFAKLAPHLDDELQRFYISLLRSEARHYQDYLQLAQAFCGDDISERVAYFRQQEALLITSTDEVFRFHSGVPAS